MKTLIKIVLITFLLIGSNTLNGQTAKTDSLEYTQIEVMGNLTDSKFRIVKPISEFKNKRYFSTKMEALNVYTTKGWDVISFSVNDNGLFTTYLLKRKITKSNDTKN